MGIKIIRLRGKVSDRVGDRMYILGAIALLTAIMALVMFGCASDTSPGSSSSCNSGWYLCSNNSGCCPDNYTCGTGSNNCPSNECCSGGGGGGGGGGCTAKYCCGGLYECNGRCYSTCTPGSQPCCSSTNCYCYTPCC